MSRLRKGTPPSPAALPPPRPPRPPGETNHGPSAWDSTSLYTAPRHFCDDFGVAKRKGLGTTGLASCFNPFCTFSFSLRRRLFLLNVPLTTLAYPSMSHPRVFFTPTVLLVFLLPFILLLLALLTCRPIPIPPNQTAGSTTLPYTLHAPYLFLCRTYSFEVPLPLILLQPIPRGG